MPESVLVRDLDFRIAPGRRGVDGRGDTVKMKPDGWPLLVAEHHNGNCSPGKVLLVAHILVRGQKQLVTGFFRLLEQITVPKFVPADLTGKSYLMTGKTAGDGIGVPLSKRIFIRTRGLFPSSGLRSAARLLLPVRSRRILR